MKTSLGRFAAVWIFTAITLGAGQSVVIHGSLTKDDENDGRHYHDIQRLPLTKGDFVAVLLVAPTSNPDMHYRFHPNSAKEDSKTAWRWTHGSHGLLEGTEAREMIATPSRGGPTRFALQAYFHTLVFMPPESGVLEMRVSSTKLAPYFFVIGKEKSVPPEELLIKGTIGFAHPKNKDGARQKIHTIPSVPDRGCMVRVKIGTPAGRPSIDGFAVIMPDGLAFPGGRWSSKEADPVTIASTGSRDYKLNVWTFGQGKEGVPPRPYEVWIRRIPNLFDLLGLSEVSP